MNKIKGNKLYRLFLLLNKRRKKQIYFLLFLIILNGIFESLSIATIIPFLSLITSNSNELELKKISQYIPQNLLNNTDIFLLITTLFCVFLLLSAMIRVFNNWYILRLTAKIDIDIGNLIFKKNIYQTYEEYTNKSSAKIISLVIEKVTASAYALNSLLNIVLTSVISISIIFSLFFYNWKIVMICVSFLIIYYLLISKKIKKILSKNGLILSKNDPLRIKIIQESFIGFRDIVINRNEKIYFNLFNKYNSIIKIKNSESQFLIVLPKFLIESLTLFIIAIIGYKLSRSNLGNADFLPLIGSFVYAFQRLLPLTQQSYAAWAGYKVKSANINDVLKELEDSDLGFNKRYLSKENKLIFNNEITLKGIAYSYDDPHYIFQDINLKIYKGDHIGIYGKTGSGKSTFLDIFMGLLSPQKGFLFVDGIDIYDTRQQNSLTSKIAHVPQSVFLKEGTIAENIAFGEVREDINHDLLKRASDIAQIYEFIKQTKNKFNTLVGERGIKLSGGQRQRIAIARAIYKSREIIVLDEATSALDEKTEKLIIDSILRNFKNLTIIMVTHRLKSLKNCNRIFEVKNTGLIEENLS